MYQPQTLVYTSRRRRIIARTSSALESGSKVVLHQSSGIFWMSYKWGALREGKKKAREKRKGRQGKKMERTRLSPTRTVSRSHASFSIESRRRQCPIPRGGVNEWMYRAFPCISTEILPSTAFSLDVYGAGWRPRSPVDLSAGGAAHRPENIGELRLGGCRGVGLTRMRTNLVE